MENWKAVSPEAPAGPRPQEESDQLHIGPQTFTRLRSANVPNWFVTTRWQIIQERE